MFHHSKHRGKTRPDLGQLSVPFDPAEGLRALSLCAAWLGIVALLTRIGYLYLERKR